MLKLTGITWNHTRGLLPLVATAQLFGETHPSVEITWEKRSLQEFADAPIDRLVGHYDLLVIDHPWAGYGSAQGVLLPLNEHLPADFLAEQQASQVGRSHESYAFDGCQTALAIDAATPVASWRSDLIGAVPKTWDEVLALARQGRVLLAGIAIDLLMSFYMVCAGLEEAPFQTDRTVVAAATGCAALETMRELAALCPRRVFSMNPIAVYQELSSGDSSWYCPFAYGYSNYARPGYAPHRLEFGDLVSLHGKRLRSVLGGTGLAVSAITPNRALALDYARFVALPEIQRTVYAASGGQPAHRSAWTDATNNLLTGNYFSATLPALDRSYLRPRYNGYLHFQDRAGDLVKEFVINGGSPAVVLQSMDKLYAESLALAKSASS